MKKFLTIVTVIVFCGLQSVLAQTYRPVSGWNKEINNKIESFLNSTLTMKERKVAVFDCDGTTFGQVPHYLADEALYRYADQVLKKRSDKEAKEKLQIINRMVESGDNVGKTYVEDRIHFLAGLSPNEIEMIGYNCYREAYEGKFFPEMKQFIANLKEYNFEVWVLTASPEILYQKFVSEQLGIPKVNILGAKCVIKEGKTTNEIILPIPQDDGKAHTIETYIKTKPLIVGGNSRGDMDMLNESAGLKIVVNPDDETVRAPEDGPMNGYTVKSYWEKEGAVIVKCDDVVDPSIDFSTTKWKIRQNRPNPK
ncbi:HAD family hydrolase [Sunxiuqinia elliptica]|uniref:Phosphoserine phosphatase n=1 Tax=Sunxiuqinia elliptica TaxID=655355 RepID=A0A4R6HBX9_9BACT|nr:haloacid dehalogenase-like hydrolase [Sunxiuqinia elliptica]TDO05527.1 phosphoserine phosphatase [Sunxiuqinia elliptica]TDO65071.1 phosphoserine phosphatase [Sunxiuqinia elliptica]